MRFITFASVILIASTLNGCSKTGTATPVTNSTSTSVRATQTSKKAQSADTNAVNDQKVEEQVNVKVGVKSDEVVSSKGSNAVVKAIGNENNKDFVILTKKSAAKVVRFADEDRATPSTLEVGKSTDGLEVPAVADAATTTYKDPFEGLEVEETPKSNYTPKEINQMKRQIYATVLNIIGELNLDDDDFKDRLQKLIKADTSALNVKYIENILFAKIDRLMDLNRSIEDAREKIEKHDAKSEELVALEQQFDDDIDRKEILGQKIKAQIDLLEKERVDVDHIHSKMVEDEQQFYKIIWEKIRRLAHRQVMLDKVSGTWKEMQKIDLYRGEQLRTVEAYENLVEQYNIATEADEPELEKIRKALKIQLPHGKNLREFIVQAIANRMEKLSEELEELDKMVKEKQAEIKELFPKDTKLAMEQIEITHA